ncbi:MAG: hypothetical protein AAFY31_04750 [Pseudomonadota bacterium]
MKVFKRTVGLATLLVAGIASNAQAETLLCRIEPGYGSGWFGPEMIISLNRDTGHVRVLDGVILDRNKGPVLSRFDARRGKSTLGYRLNVPTRARGTRTALFRATLFEETGRLNLFVNLEHDGHRKSARGSCRRSDRPFEAIEGFGTTRARPYPFP